MPLHNTQKLVTTGRRRLGQGHGSGRGKTSGRGTKGTHARNKVSLSFEGGALPLIKRLPFLRGKGRNDSLHPDPIVLNVSVLNSLPAKTVVTIETLVAHKLVKADNAKKKGIKILGNGDITNAYTVAVPVSKSAAAKIEQAGGKVEYSQ